jgi:hypothetical protein
MTKGSESIFDTHESMTAAYVCCMWTSKILLLEVQVILIKCSLFQNMYV